MQVGFLLFLQVKWSVGVAFSIGNRHQRAVTEDV